MKRNGEKKRNDGIFKKISRICLNYFKEYEKIHPKMPHSAGQCYCPFSFSLSLQEKKVKDKKGEYNRGRIGIDHATDIH